MAIAYVNYFLLRVEQKSKDESICVILNTNDERSKKMNEQLLTLAEAQAILRVSKSKMYRLIHQEGLPAVRLGSTYRIRISELEKYLLMTNKTENQKEDYYYDYQ